MPSFLSLAESPGFLLLEEGGLMLLSESDPVAANDAQLYELDRIETAFKSILQSYLPAGAIAMKKRELKVDRTPRVEMVFTAIQNKDQRYIRFTDNAFAPAQPLNAWDYTLQLTIVTNRGQNNSSHQTITGVVRWCLQYYRLLQTWDTSVAPYHAITSIQEAQVENNVESDEDCDYERLTFFGMCNIRDSAWPAL